MSGLESENPGAIVDRVPRDVIAETLWLIDQVAASRTEKPLTRALPRVQAGFGHRADAVIAALKNAGYEVTRL